MTKFPGARSVERTLRSVKKEIKGSLKQIHQAASKMLARGNYSGAEALMDVARAVKTFEADAEALRMKWRGLRGNAAGDEARRQKTPLWEYYRPILQTLESANGSASLSELLVGLEPLLGKALKQEDLELMSNGRPRWHSMVRKARRALKKEGFIEAGGGKEWVITGAGRKAAVGQAPTK